MRRAELMLERTAAEIIAPALARAGFAELAARCRSLRTLTELVAIARGLRNANSAALYRPLVTALDHAADAGRQWLAGLPTEIVFCTFSALREIASLEGEQHPEQVYRRAAAILDTALAIGNRADATAVDVVADRMDSAKRASEAAYRGETTAA